ncbi:MAG: hypothetical protein ACLP9L_35900 [Thermoguttaceae bacterium]
MIGEWAFRTAALCLVLVIQATAISRADTPWYNLLATSRVEADPAKPYTLKEEHGPWIIMACSFNGENAQQQAHDLVLELRKRYRVEAFVHRMDFKLDDPNGNVQPLYRSPHSHQYHMVTENPNAYRDGTIKEIAVVVGNFPAIDDPDAQKALQKLKTADPECFHANSAGTQSRSLAAWRSLQASVRDLPQYIESRRQTGPLAHAFITRNPLLPEDYFAPKGGIDELVLKMNKNVKYSLLDCPGKYTVQVAHFTGEVIINQSEIRAIETGAKAGPESTKQGLASAAEKAHELTEALRIKGYEAYEFHDRCASLVTVGSFDSVGTPRPDGRIEINPQVHRIIKVFRGQSADVPGKPGAMYLRSLVGIYFDVQPIPVEVPKRSISRQLTQRLDMAGE